MLLFLCYILLNVFLGSTNMVSIWDRRKKELEFSSSSAWIFVCFCNTLKAKKKRERVIFFFSFIYFSWRLITILLWFLPYIDMNQPWIYTCSPSRSPLPLPSPSHPFGSSQCTSPEHLSHASNLDWRFISQLIIYMFQCHSLRTSPPRLLRQSPKVCSIHLFFKDGKHDLPHPTAKVKQNPKGKVE